jgi:hypothetical protein
VNAEGTAEGPEAPAQRARRPAAALPCQNSNNSDKPPPRYRLKPLPGQPGVYTSQAHKNAVWDEDDNDPDLIRRCGMPSSAEAKAAFHLRLNVESFVKYWGREHILFFTLTDQDNLHPTQFARRWNHFLRRNGAWITSFIRVLEPQRRGSPHYHLLAAVPWDTRPDAFDWAAFNECQQERKANGPTPRFKELRARYKASAAPELVALWASLRKVLPRYGLGRAELLPIRKGKEAISIYVGKYLEGGLTLRRHSWKGCRRVEFDRRAKTAWLACSRVIAWHSKKGKIWRSRVGQLAAIFGIADMDDFKRRFGPRWAYWLRETLTLASDEEFAEFCANLAEAAGS